MMMTILTIIHLPYGSDSDGVSELKPEASYRCESHSSCNLLGNIQEDKPVPGVVVEGAH